MNLALTYDHRLIDGREAVTFLKRIKVRCCLPCWAPMVIDTCQLLVSSVGAGAGSRAAALTTALMTGHTIRY